MKQSQGFGMVAIIGVLAVVVLIGGFLFVSNQSTTQTDTQMAAEKMKMEEAAMMEKKLMEEKAMIEKDAMMKNDDSMIDKGGAAMEDKAGAMMDKEEIIKKDDAMMDGGDSAMMQKTGTYTNYSGEALAMAQKGKTVLFFHAGWCPTCRTADADIKNNVTTIPAGATILKVDFDKEVALKQKYGVTSQHTFVEIDANGGLVEKWSGGNLAGIIAKL